MTPIVRVLRVVLPLSVLAACADDPESPAPALDPDGGGGAYPGSDGGPAGDGGAPAAPSLPGIDAGTAVMDGDAGSAPNSATDASLGGADGGAGTCCGNGDCLCHGPAPTELTAKAGPYKTQSYTIAGVGCVVYPSDATGPLAAVAVSDGFGGSGGCGFSQTGDWGPLYASWGIVTMIVATGAGDQPNTRGEKLSAGIAAFKKANEDAQSPLFGKLGGRYGTSGFSMGGGGTSYASQADATLRSSVAVMPWGPTTTNITVPTLVICGSSDTVAPCGSHGTRLYAGIADSVPKMRVQVSSGHAGQPSAGNSASGAYGLAFQKVFLEGDERWRPLLTAAKSEASNIR